MPGINSVYHPFQIDLSFKLYLDVYVYFLCQSKCVICQNSSYLTSESCGIVLNYSKNFFFKKWQLWHAISAHYGLLERMFLQKSVNLWLAQ